MKYIKLLLCVAIAFSLGVCFYPPHAEEVKKNKLQELTSVSVATNGFQMTISIAISPHAVGKQLKMKAIIENISTNTLPIRESDGLMDYELQLVGPDGKAVKATDLGEQYLNPTSLYHRSLVYVEPRQSINISVDLNDIYFLTNPGKYSLRVSRRIYAQGRLCAGPIYFLLTDLAVSTNQLHKIKPVFIKSDSATNGY